MQARQHNHLHISGNYLVGTVTVQYKGYIARANGKSFLYKHICICSHAVSINMQLDEMHNKWSYQVLTM